MNPPSPKSTKADLFAAFEEMRKKYEESLKQPSAFSKAEEQQVLQHTAELTPTKLEDDITNLRRQIQNHLDTVLAQLNDEGKKLSDIRSAIDIESRRLSEAHNIDIAVSSLRALIEEYDSKAKELQTNYKNMEEESAEAMARKKKDWEREQEEYTYSLKMERRKEDDVFELEKTKKENKWKEEMAKREQQIAEQEETLQKRAEEIAALEKTASELPEKIRLAEETAVKTATENARAKNDLEMKLKMQEWQAEKMMLQAKIDALAESSKLQTEEIRSLKTALANANQQAQTLAATVIENMAGNKNVKTTAGENE
ncbi:MAG: hypothetical protein HY980_01000 [Candidatus Magasanikbacteria bacterium]|nr:hypothetical protein [Candidatus Magasanikbacteria bacterium]